MLTLLLSAVSTVAITNSKGEFSLPVRQVHTLVRRDGSVAVHPHVIIDFTFGTQVLPMSIDSGCTFTWVAADIGSNTVATTPGTLYHPNVSSTYHDENSPQDAYDCGNKENFCVMGLEDISAGGLKATQMPFGLGSRVNQGYFASGQVGSMGFGRQSGNPASWLPRDQPFWYRIGGSLSQPYLFTFNIHDFDEGDGTMDFGWIDHAKYTGDIVYTKMGTDSSQWNFELTGVFDTGTGQQQTSEAFGAYMDSGNGHMYLPPAIIGAYYKSVGGALKPDDPNAYQLPCSAYPPPSLTLELVGGGKLVLDGKYLAFPPESTDQTMCYGRVATTPQTSWNFGVSVMAQKFIVFDHANQQIGFADRA